MDDGQVSLSVMGRVGGAHTSGRPIIECFAALNSQQPTFCRWALLTDRMASALRSVSHRRII
ncbi:hypothetical protein HanXRQr2_Chr13g0610131 [Helianthus annuus]|uniref:Uncharacterized protein n=1 Tax=Helianthus annuus TaxID=4232 RepID=A0A9K3ELM8_HELAN|nr:hypothetical protein HanXRQr2_Chr13g0610131 [Helianthus annuus]